MKEADVLLIHIPSDNISLGTSAELGFFKGLNPHKPIICYKCTDHSWLNKLCDVRIETPQELIEVLVNLALSKNILKG